jgi:hypothetical protein
MLRDALAFVGFPELSNYRSSHLSSPSTYRFNPLIIQAAFKSRALAS